MFEQVRRLLAGRTTAAPVAPVRMSSPIDRPSPTPETAGYVSIAAQYQPRPRDLPPLGFDMIRSMLLDPAVRLGLQMRIAPICGVEIAYNGGAGPDGKVKWVPGVLAKRPEVGEFVRRQLARVWTHGLEEILTAQVWGWSAGEVMLRLTSRGSVEVDYLLGRHAIDTRALIRGGAVVGARVMRVTSAAGGNVDLEFNEAKGWFHSYRPEAGAFYGQSILLGCYSPWADKAFQGGATDVRRLFMHADAYGGKDMTYPDGVTRIGNEDVANRDLAMQIIEQLQAGGVTARPAIFDQNGNELWKLTRATVASNPAHILQFPKDLDTEIYHGLEIPDDVIESDTGAWAGKRIPMAAFYNSLDLWVMSILGTLTEQLLEPLVLLNFGRAEEFAVTHKPLGQQAMEQQGDAGQKGQQPGQSGQPQQSPAGNPQQQYQAGPQDIPQQYGVRSQQRMGLDPWEAVGHGVLNAAELVQAAREVIDGRRAQRMAVDASGHEHKGKGTGGGQFTAGSGGGAAVVDKPSKVHAWASRRFKDPEHAANFVKWFGDSKVVDEKGEPLVVYHGTDMEFSEFDTKAADQMSHWTSQLGSFFTSDAETANMFTGSRKGRVIPVYVSLKNPYRIPVDRWLKMLTEKQSISTYGENRDDRAKQVRQRLVEKGHDGIIIEPSEKHPEMKGGMQIAFSANQIKSATGSRGTFDPADNRITMASADGTKWVTIGGRKDGSDEHAGGFPVQLDENGVVLKGGPKGLRGKHVSKIVSHFKKMRNTPQQKAKRAESTIKKQAKLWDMSPEQYKQFSDQIWRDKTDEHKARESAKTDARKSLGVTAGDVRRLEEQGFDYGSGKIKGLDTIGRELASQYPELNWGGGYGSDTGDVDDTDYDSKVWELLKEGKQELPAKDSPEFHQEVDEYLNYLANQSSGGSSSRDDEDDDSPIPFGLQGQFKFDEDEHPRDDDGKFKSGGVVSRGAGGKAKAAKDAMAKHGKKDRPQYSGKLVDIQGDGDNPHAAFPYKKPHGHNDWKVIAAKHSDSDFQKIYDHIMSLHRNDSAFAEQVTWMAENDQAVPAAIKKRPIVGLARAAMEQHAGDLVKGKLSSDDRKAWEDVTRVAGDALEKSPSEESTDNPNRDPDDIHKAVQKIIDGDRVSSRGTGHMTLVSMEDLRRHLPQYSREELDAEIRKLRESGEYTMETGHGRTTQEMRDAGIKEGSDNLIWISRRS